MGLTPAQTDATVRAVKLLTAAACFLNRWFLQEYGGHAGADRGTDLVEAVVGAAFQSFAGEDPHPDPFEKAAMLMRGITQGHPFGDGNKRTGFGLAAYYLHLMGIDRPLGLVGEEQYYAFNIAVSAGDIRDIEDVADGLRRLWSVSEEGPG